MSPFHRSSETAVRKFRQGAHGTWHAHSTEHRVSCFGEDHHGEKTGVPGDDPMKASLEWIEMTQEADFSDPLFDLPGRNAEVLKALHRFIHPRFPLRSSDMQALGGNTLSDVSVRLTMFEGHGTISVTAEKFSGYFRGLKRDEDIGVCNECITLASQGLASAMPENRVSAVATQAISWAPTGRWHGRRAQLPERGCQTGCGTQPERIGKHYGDSVHQRGDSRRE